VIKIYERLEDVPDNWEKTPFQDNVLFSREFLKHLRNTNPVRQFYFLSDAKEPLIGGVFFETVIRSRYFGLKAPIAVCRFPFALPIQGFVNVMEKMEALKRLMENRPQPLSLIVIKGERPAEVPKGWAIKPSLPYLFFRNRFKDFDHYRASLRRSYRHSIDNSVKKWKSVVVKQEGKDKFGRDHYQRYLTTWRKSAYRWDPMKYDFFSRLPIPHIYLSAYADDQLIGWVLLLFGENKAYAPLCGLDSAYVKEYDTWKNLHLEAIRYTINNGFSKVDFGETTTLGKLRLGCDWEPVYNLVRHRSELAQYLINKGPFFKTGEPWPLKSFQAYREMS
jgi:hypothetical protein